MKELDQQSGGGTSPVEFARDRRELQSLLERFTKQPRDFAFRAHPHFGAMSEKVMGAAGLFACGPSPPQFGC